MPEVDYNSFVRLKEKVEILTGERGSADKPGAAVLQRQLSSLKVGGAAPDNREVLQKIAELQRMVLGKDEQAADSAKLATKTPAEIRRQPWCNTSGGSNTVKLAPVGVPVGALAQGDLFHFRATSSNAAGGMTVAVGDLAAMPVLTVTGAEPPSGYIRTDADTVLRYDAALGSFIAGREDERGSGSGGDWIRYACGRVEMSLIASAGDYAEDEKRSYRWALPATGAKLHPSATVLMDDTTELVTVLGASTDQPGRIYFYLLNGPVAQRVTLSMSATGLWY